MKLYFGGTEIPSWNSLLLQQGVTHVSMSFVGLSRRNKFTKPWLVSERFDPSQTVFLDSGAYSVNKDPDKYTHDEIRDLADKYMAFAYENLDSLEMVSEFDAMPLGFDWIKAQREDFYDDLGDKFLPIWHPEHGLDELDRLASTYDRVGVMQTSLGERSIVSKLNSLVARYGTKLHGVAMSKMEVMQSVKWDSVGSKSWLNTSTYGETFVWTSQGLSWYPAKMKDQARKRHRNIFVDNGFDVQKIENDDTNELLKLSIWSWGKFVEDINRKKNFANPALIVTNPAISGNEPNAEVDGEPVDNPTPQTPHPELIPRGLNVRETKPLPFLSITTREEAEGGMDMNIRGTSMRACDTCFLREKCPEMVPNSTCVFEIPVEIKTLNDVKNVQNSLIAMQTKRVMFMGAIEDAEGGYADPNLTKEISLLNNLIKAKQESEEKGLSISMTVKEKGGMGQLSRLFGSEAAEKAMAVNNPKLIEQMAVESGIVDAEVVGDDSE